MGGRRLWHRLRSGATRALEFPSPLRGLYHVVRRDPPPDSCTVAAVALERPVLPRGACVSPGSALLLTGFASGCR